MRYTAIGIAPLPDVLTARKNYALQDLSDEDVAKVLFHRRKQDGGGDALGWDQLRFGAVSLVQLGGPEIRVDSLVLQDNSEMEMIEAIFRALRDAPPLVTWGGSRGFLPLLQFRCLKHRRDASDYWTSFEDRRHPHMDLQQELSGSSVDCAMPSLDDMAQRLFLPGMLGRSDADLWDQWLQDDQQALARFADYQALNTALLALEIFFLKGRASHAEVKAQHDRLFDWISDPDRADDYAEFVQCWAQRA